MRVSEVEFPEAVVEQTEISLQDRALLVDWMCRLHYKAQLTTESFYRAVGILDRAIALVHISPQRLRVIGAAAMLIASKIEDLRPMTTDHAVSVAQNEFSEDDLKQMEVQLINLIEFNTEFPTPLFFLTRFISITDHCKELALLSRYLLELAMTSGEFLGVRPSAIAASALMMTHTLAGMEPWTEEMAGYAQYGFEDLCGYCRVFHAMLLEPQREESNFMRKKYASEPFGFVANVPVPPELPLPFPYYE
jgi:transcription initiation factor TFIIIB Brf1 subunit/transcription initiation factor TFIIB